MAKPIDLADVAHVMESLGAEIEALGAVLCCDPAVAERHLLDLQAIDRIAQFQRALAQILRSGSGVTTAGIGLEELARRLDVAATTRPPEHGHLPG